MSEVQYRSVSNVALSVGSPLVLAILEVFHPHVHDVMDVVPRIWLAIHYAQIPLFGLAALAMTTLIRGQRGFAASVSRVAMFVFAVCYIAFDTAAGVVTGVMVQAARESGAVDGWRGPIEAVWNHVIIGGSPAVTPPPLFAVLGSVAWSVGAVFAAVCLKRAGASWLPCLLLGVSSFGIGVFRTHAWPGGPVTFGGFALAAAWIAYERGIRVNSG